MSVSSVSSVNSLQQRLIFAQQAVQQDADGDNDGDGASVSQASAASAARTPAVNQDVDVGNRIDVMA